MVKCNIAGPPSSLASASTPGLRDHRPATSAPVVQKLLDAGAIVVAKTNMPEFAIGPGDNNVH